MCVCLFVLVVWTIVFFSFFLCFQRQYTQFTKIKISLHKKSEHFKPKGKIIFSFLYFFLCIVLFQQVRFFSQFSKHLFIYLFKTCFFRLYFTVYFTLFLFYLYFSFCLSSVLLLLLSFLNV